MRFEEKKEEEDKQIIKIDAIFQFIGNETTEMVLMKMTARLSACGLKKRVLKREFKREKNKQIEKIDEIPDAGWNGPTEIAVVKFSVCCVRRLEEKRKGV